MGTQGQVKILVHRERGSRSHLGQIPNGPTQFPISLGHFPDLSQEILNDAKPVGTTDVPCLQPLEIW